MVSSRHGRFISVSPLAPTGEEEYVYCQSDPVNLIDKNGNFANFVAGAAIGVGADAAYAWYNGDDYTWGDAAQSAVNGAVGGKLVGSLGKWGAGLVRRGVGGLLKGSAKRAVNLADDAAKYLPDYVFSSKAEKCVVPGTRNLSGQYINNLGRIEPWEAYYDEFGRMVARTDMNAGNLTNGIPSIHHHLYDNLLPNIPEKASHIPGAFVP